MPDVSFMNALTVLSVFRAGRRVHSYGVERETHMPTGTVHGILKRFEGEGLLSSELERVDPSLSSRVPRLLYQLTPGGNDFLAQVRALVST